MRLDLLRGLAALAMIVDHIGGKDSLLYLVSGGDRFFVSAAEGFVFISGLVMGMVYAGVLARGGIRAGLVKGMKRVGTLYALTVVLSLVFAAVSLELGLSWSPDVASPSAALNFLVDTLTLRHAHYLTDVLLLYTLVIAASLPALALMHRWRRTGWLVLGGSWALWAAGQWWPNSIQMPFGITGGDMFRFTEWQVLFVTALVVGYYRKTLEGWASRLLEGRARAWAYGLGLLLCGAVVAGSVALYLWAQANPQETAAMTFLGDLFGKADLRMGRLALFAFLFGFLYLLCTLAWGPVRKLAARLLLPLGQDALTAYTMHLFVVALLAAAGPQLLGSTVESLGGRTLLQAFGIVAIWAIIRAKAPAMALSATAFGTLKRWAAQELVGFGGLLQGYLARVPGRNRALSTARTARHASATQQARSSWARASVGLAALAISAVLLVPTGRVLASAIKNSHVVAAISGRSTPAAATMPSLAAITTGNSSASLAASTPVAVNNSLAMLMSGTAVPQSAASPTPVVLPDYVQQRSFVSQSLGRSMPYYIFLPPGYASHPETRYPVLYMLHGISGTNTEWLGYGLPGKARDMMAAGQISEFIIVLPQGDQGYWVDQPNGGPQWGTYVARDLVSEIDSHFRTLADRQHRAVGGLSMGGSGALTLAILHPDVFGVVSASSPSLHAYADAPAFYDSQANFNALDPVYLYKNKADVARTLKLYIDVGQQDPWLPVVQSFHSMLQSEGVVHQWQTFPGGHEGTYWSTHVPDYLLFYSSAFLAQAATSLSQPTPTPLPSSTVSPVAAGCGTRGVSCSE